MKHAHLLQRLRILIEHLDDLRTDVQRLHDALADDSDEDVITSTGRESQS